MQDVGVCEDAITYVSVLKSSGNLGAINSIRQIHKEILLKGYDLDAYLVATLIVSYAKCCSLASAENIFEKCYEHSVILWNSMITGLGMNHEVHDAIGLFKAMKGKGLKPDAITFLCLFTACGRTSVLDIGQEFLNFMTKQYHYLQTSDHFSSIVDLLARSGFLNEAEKFLETLPCTGSDDTWTSLLSASRNYLQTGSGTRCFNQLFQMKPYCASGYVLLSNLFASEKLTRNGGCHPYTNYDEELKSVQSIF
ncbi:hypothetical protein KP509_37G036500 [Ceratopteris richardii]|nr:hypothetical protein KP509_37G036500 [Ceratopteris richardii]